MSTTLKALSAFEHGSCHRRRGQSSTLELCSLGANGEWARCEEAGGPLHLSCPPFPKLRPFAIHFAGAPLAVLSLCSACHQPLPRADDVALKSSTAKPLMSWASAKRPTAVKLAQVRSVSRRDRTGS